MSEVIQTSNNIKQNFRDKMRKYFSSQYSFGLQHIRDVVFMLMNFPDINAEFKNYLRQKYPEKYAQEYQLTIRALKQYDTLYNYSSLINDSILKLKESDSEHAKTKIDHQNKNLLLIATKLPPTEFRIMRAFFVLVNSCDLRNVSVPKDDRFDNRNKYPSYLGGSEGGSGGGSF